jgi:hypothetical protein
MAIAVHIKPHQLKDDYERVIRELEKDGTPSGRLSHTSYGDDDKVQMFDVWSSPDEYQADHDRLVGTLQSAGLDAGISVDTAPVQRHVD